MTTPPHPDRAEWEFRQCGLAYRLLCVEARTQTICRLTSLSVHRLSSWRTRWGFDESERSRGPAPNSFAPFFRSPTLRIEGAYLAVLCESFGVLHPHRREPSTFYCLTTGERLCDLLDFHRACFPAASVSFDQLLLLARGLEARKSILLQHCAACGGAILADPLQLPRRNCDSCKGKTAHVQPDHITHADLRAANDLRPPNS